MSNSERIMKPSSTWDGCACTHIVLIKQAAQHLENRNGKKQKREQDQQDVQQVLLDVPLLEKPQPAQLMTDAAPGRAQNPVKNNVVHVAVKVGWSRKGAGDGLDARSCKKHALK